jgi:hypothetical protein
MGEWELFLGRIFYQGFKGFFSSWEDLVVNQKIMAENLRIVSTRKYNRKELGAKNGHATLPLLIQKYLR